MSASATTTLSSKGQVVIPEEIRARLGLKAGVQFIVLGERDAIIFKVLTPPALSEFAELLGRTRRAAKKAGIRAADVSTAVSRVRRAR